MAPVLGTLLDAPQNWERSTPGRIQQGQGANAPSAVTNLTKERITVTASVWSIV